jgi:hypothetical protein
MIVRIILDTWTIRKVGILKAILVIGSIIISMGAVAITWLAKHERETFSWSPEGWEHDDSPVTSRDQSKVID